MEFCELVRSARESKYASAKEFFRHSKLECSYFYYSKVESGTLPDVKIAMKIAEDLGINLRKAMYAWVRGQMPTNETKAFFTELDDRTPRSAEQLSIERSIVVNRMQAGLLESDLIYWELVLYLSTHYGHAPPSEKELSKVFKLPVSKILGHLKKLYEYGLIDKNKAGHFVTREWVYIPYEPDYTKLRDLNFKRAFEQFFRHTGKSKFRTTITRLLTPSQQKEIEAMAVALTNSIVDLSDDAAPPEAVPCTIGIFASPREFGNV